MAFLLSLLMPSMPALPRLRLFGLLAFSLAALFMTPTLAEPCSAVKDGAKVDSIANVAENQPPGTCSVRNLSMDECKSLPGYKHFQDEPGSGHTACFFSRPLGPLEKDSGKDRDSSDEAVDEPAEQIETDSAAAPPPAKPPSYPTAEDIDECTKQLIKAEETVNSEIEANALSETDAEKALELLDEVDGHCTEAKLKAASDALEDVTRLLAKAKE